MSKRSTGETVKTVKRGNHTFYIRLEQPFNTYAVRVKVKNMEPFYLENNNDYDTADDAHAAIKRYIKENNVSIDDAYEKRPGQRGSEEAWKNAAKLLMAVRDGKEKEWLTLLGLDETPTLAVLKKAYKVAARKAHPDLGGSTEQMHKVTEAYEKLQLLVTE